MDLTVSTSEDEIRQLRDALRGTLGSARDDAVPAPDAEWRRGWKALAALGVTALCAPEERGGFGLQVQAAVTVAREFGAALHGSPYAGLTASVHALAGCTDGSTDGLVSGILSGEWVCSFGVLDASGRVARAVDGGPDADAVVLLDRSRDDLVVLGDPSAWAFRSPRHGFDVTRASGDVDVDPTCGLRIGGAATARDIYGLLLAADALGCMQRMIDRTVAYAGQREAFGRPIGGFQAVQHRLVDHTIRVRGMSLLITEAAGFLSAGSPLATRFVAMAEVAVSSRAVHILHDLLQLTGAIGFTWEYGLHFYERRAHQDARLVANPRSAVRLLAQIEGWADAR
jgi:alkylation response protein AidB-like acyl-CoA dehydrogenase